MKMRDLPGWPPRWEPYDLGNVAIGEVGRLRGAGSTEIQGQLHILIEHRTALYSGKLMLDEELLVRVLTLLTRQIGTAIERIADLDIPGK
jgi:hypothetical protein